MNCVQCGRALSYDEHGLNKKFNAGGGFACIHCLAQKLDVSVERLKEKMEELRRAGCLYFTQHKQA